jgi:hypothetical protein
MGIGFPLFSLHMRRGAWGGAPVHLSKNDTTNFQCVEFLVLGGGVIPVGKYACVFCVALFVSVLTLVGYGVDTLFRTL